MLEIVDRSSLKISAEDSPGYSGLIIPGYKFPETPTMKLRTSAFWAAQGPWQDGERIFTSYNEELQKLCRSMSLWVEFITASGYLSARKMRSRFQTLVGQAIDKHPLRLAFKVPDTIKWIIPINSTLTNLETTANW